MAKDNARPRKSSRAIRRRFKATARFAPLHSALSQKEKTQRKGGQVRATVLVSKTAAGEAWPVGPVSRFRSTDGQLAASQLLSGLTTGLTGALLQNRQEAGPWCNQSVEVGSFPPLLL